MRRVHLLILAIVLTSCAHDMWVSERLFFGRSIPGGGMVSDEEWSAFVREVVTPRFPSGLTMHSASGQWREASGKIVSEPVVIIELLHPRSEADDRAIAEIVHAYREKFHQEAVLRVRWRSRVSFTE